MADPRLLKSTIGAAFVHTWTFEDEAGDAFDASGYAFEFVVYDRRGGSALLTVANSGEQWDQSGLASGVLTLAIKHSSSKWTDALNVGNRASSQSGHVYTLWATHLSTGVRVPWVAGAFERYLAGEASRAGSNGTTVTVSTSGDVTAVTVIDASGIRAAQAAAEAAAMVLTLARTPSGGSLTAPASVTFSLSGSTAAMATISQVQYRDESAGLPYATVTEAGEDDDWAAAITLEAGTYNIVAVVRTTTGRRLEYFLPEFTVS